MGASEQLLLAASFNLVAAVVFLGGLILAILHMRRANKDREVLIDRLWNVNAEVMEQSAANANLDSYVYRQQQKRRVEQMRAASEAIPPEISGTGAA
jgi:hypothetical protein